MREEEKQSIFDQFETDEETGEVIIPRATVGVARDLEPGLSDAREEQDPARKGEGKEIGSQEKAKEENAGPEDGLPVVDLDLNFTEEDLVEVKEAEDEDSMLKSIDAALEQEMASAMGDGLEKQAEEKKKNLWTRLPLWLRITGISVASLFLIVALLVGTKPGRKIVINLIASYIYRRVEHPTEKLTPPPSGPTDVVLQPSGGLEPSVTPGTDDPELSVTPGTDDPEPTQAIAPPPPGAPRQEEYCYNVLLIGEEALPYFGTGSRSDSMILLSVNKKDKKIRMTSLMRDMFVQIDGYSDNRLNAAYAKGGAKLLIDTIERNLKVKIDDYVQVNFDNFEWIIDRLGGVEITLTEQEASYLRRTRYITNPAYRNVVAGTQLMNGNQALGYCRVRMVPTANGTDSDFGRTERQRTVLTKLFNKYKEKNIFTLLGILNDCLPKVTTSMSKEAMSDLLETVVEERILSMETMRIPIARTYENVYVKIGNDTKSSEVLAVKWPQNIEALQEFIFGTGEEGQ